MAQTHSRQPPHSRSAHSQHAGQELKDDLLDYTTLPVVMQWFNALTAVGALMTHKFYSVKRQTILLVNGELLESESVNKYH